MNFTYSHKNKLLKQIVITAIPIGLISLGFLQQPHVYPLTPADGFIPGTQLILHSNGIRDLRIPLVKDYQQGYVVRRDLKGKGHIDQYFDQPRYFPILLSITGIEKLVSTKVISRTETYNPEVFDNYDIQFAQAIAILEKRKQQKK